jgi:regulator of RNase E activity RraB
MLDLDIILKETKSMFELAQKCDVDYAGWGTYFEE